MTPQNYVMHVQFDTCVLCILPLMKKKKENPMIFFPSNPQIYFSFPHLSCGHLQFTQSGHGTLGCISDWC